MKRLLLPLLTALALPSTINAESYWLVLEYDGMTRIEMESLEQCEEQGKKYMSSKRGSKNNSGYVSTKFAINGITQSLSKELGNKNIRVNAICPVLIRTDGLLKALAEKSAPGYKNIDSFLEEFKKTQTALNRLPSIDDVAQMVLFLASKNASAITGQCINYLVYL